MRQGDPPSASGTWGKCSGPDRVAGFQYRDARLPHYRLFSEGSGFLMVTDSAVSKQINTVPVGVPGVIYVPSGMNRDGIFLELNSGNWEGYYPDRPSIFLTLFSFLETYGTREQVQTAFQSVSANLSSLVNVADPNVA